MTSTIDYLGFRFLDADLSGVRSALSNELSGGGYGYVVTPNVDHVVSYHRGGNPDLVAAYDHARFQICDSRVLAILARLSNRHLTPCPGSDLTESLLREPLANGRRIAVIGPSLADFEILQRRFPDNSLSHIESAQRLVIGSVGWDETLRRARDAEWDILLICLSFPKQEFFAFELAERNRRSGLALCVGASVDFLTGRQNRAPSALQKAGLEWLFRLASDPKRMVERYLLRGPAIFPIVANDLLKPLPIQAPPRSEGEQAMRILYLSTVLPHRLQSGGEICSMNFIEALQLDGCDVEVVAYQRDGEGSSETVPPGFRSPRPLVIESGQSRMHTAYWMLRSLLHRRAFSVDKYVTRAMRAIVRRRLREIRWDLVVIDHAQAGWLLPLVPEGFPVVLVAHNVEHRLYDAYGARPTGEARPGLRERLKTVVYRREARRLLTMEREAARRCREIWCLSESDGAEFRALAPASRVRVFSVPGQSFPEADLPAPTVDIGLLGSWVWDVNRAGLDWFLHSVAPLLPAGLEIVVGGKSKFSPDTRLGDVRFAGFVPDAGDFLRQCRVVAIPSTLGSGIQIKTIETLALGVPTVATPVAMRGIDEPPPTVRIASDAREMAAAIQESLHAPRPDGAEGRQWWKRRRDRFRADIVSALAEMFPKRQHAGVTPKHPSASPATRKGASADTVPIEPGASLRNIAS